MTPDVTDSYDRLPESLTETLTLFGLHEQELVDLAAVFQLTAADGTHVPAAIEAMAAAHDVELQQNLATRQALLDGEIAFAEEDMTRRTGLLPQLEKNYELRAALREAQAAAAADVVKLEVTLLGRRQEAEEERFERELLRVQNQEAAAVTGAAQEVVSGAPVVSARQQYAHDLEERRKRILDEERKVFEREEELRARSITRTISGFLLWLGYASVVATGSVLAMIMSGSNAFDLQPLAAASRTLVGSVFPMLPAWVRLFIVLGLVLGLLWLLVRVFVACDNLLRHQWQWDEKAPGDATAQMSPQALTPRTYSGFVALLPFAFAIATIMTILALAPPVTTATGDAEDAFLASVFPGVGYSFVGITIAFLSTAVFTMYFIYIFQPRGSSRTSLLRASWEFAVAPVMLVLALALAPLYVKVDAARWLPWAAFMLLSSFSLAAGLVFHGVFKDARRARERVRKVDRQLQRLTGVPADAEDESESTERPERRPSPLRWLEQTARRTRLGRAMIGAPTEAADADDGEAQTRRGSSTALVPGYRTIDVIVAPELVHQLEAKRAAAARIAADLDDLNAAISDLEEVLSFEAMSTLSRRLLMLKAIKVALVSHQEERRQHAMIAKELLLLKVGGTSQSAHAIAPLFASVRSAVMTDEGVTA